METQRGAAAAGGRRWRAGCRGTEPGRISWVRLDYANPTESMERSEKVRKEQYRWKPVRRVYIPKSAQQDPPDRMSYWKTNTRPSIQASHEIEWIRLPKNSGVSSREWMVAQNNRRLDPRGRRKNPEYTRLTNIRTKAKKKGDWNAHNEAGRKRRSMPSVITNDDGYRKLEYVRPMTSFSASQVQRKKQRK